ncbi:hypothetical protein [Agrobacterium sp. 22-222-1]
MSCPDSTKVSDRINQALDNVLAERRIVGAVVLAAINGKIVHRRAAEFPTAKPPISAVTFC